MDIGTHRPDFFALIGRLRSVNEGEEPGGDGRGGFAGEKVPLSMGSGSSLPRGEKTIHGRSSLRPTVGR